MHSRTILSAFDCGDPSQATPPVAFRRHPPHIHPKKPAGFSGTPGRGTIRNHVGVPDKSPLPRGGMSRSDRGEFERQKPFVKNRRFSFLIRLFSQLLVRLRRIGRYSLGYLNLDDGIDNHTPRYIMCMREKVDFWRCGSCESKLKFFKTLTNWLRIDI